MPETKKYLNRDGLEEYNSLLPHSSAEIQEYVDDWLDAHPEATTTVQDGSITTQKLADGSVTRNKLAADVAHLLGGMMVTGEVQGEILSASDAYSVAPLSMEVYGKSTQNGTPTPDAPVPIDSIEVLELPVTFAGKNLLSDKKSEYIASGTWFNYGFAMEDGASYTYSRMPGNNNTLGFVLYVSDVPLGTAGFREFDTTVLTYRNPFTYTNRNNHKYLYVRMAMSAFNSEPDIVQRRQGQIEYGAHATAYTPYFTPNTAQIPMQGHVLRSLPDGTCDTMTLSYLRESDQVGWAWYGRELVQNVSPIVFNGILPSGGSYTDYSFNVSRSSASPDYTYIYSGMWDSVINGVGACDKLVQLLDAGGSGSVVDTDSIGNGSSAYRIRMLLLATRLGIDWDADDGVARTRKFNAWIVDNPITALCKLATPITTQLDPIELPILPAPNCTVWSDPTTGLKMSYMRDANIVISNIEQAIADL